MLLTFLLDIAIRVQSETPNEEKSVAAFFASMILKIFNLSSRSLLHCHSYLFFNRYIVALALASNMMEDKAYVILLGAAVVAASAAVLYRKVMGNTLDSLVYRLQQDDDPERTEISCEQEGIEAIGDEGATQVAAALTKNTTLTSLDLNGMKIGDAGAEKIAMALLLNDTLTLIRLHKNRITNKGAERLALALRHNHTLTTLYISLSNPIKDDKINEEIQRLVTINKEGPEEAARQKAALYGAKWNAEGSKLKKEAEKELADYEASVPDAQEAGEHKKTD